MRCGGTTRSGGPAGSGRRRPRGRGPTRSVRRKYRLAKRLKGVSCRISTPAGISFIPPSIALTTKNTEHVPAANVVITHAFCLSVRRRKAATVAA